MTEKNEMLKLAEKIERAAKQHEFDRRVATYNALAAVLTRRPALIVAALRAAAASAEPVAWQRRMPDRYGGWQDWIECSGDAKDQQRWRNVGAEIRPLYTHPAPVSASARAAPTIDDVPSCGQENDFRRARGHE